MSKIASKQTKPPEQHQKDFVLIQRIQSLGEQSFIFCRRR